MDKKDCPKCGRCLPLDAFYPARTKRSGVQSYCKDCQLSGRKNYKRKQYAWSQMRRLRLYSITQSDYDEMTEEQDEECAICGRPETRTNQYGLIPLSIDHDHNSGKVRGLLCAKCNTMLGLAEDNIGTLLKAIFYLEENRYG